MNAYSQNRNIYSMPEGEWISWAGLVALQFTERLIAKPHVPCVAAKREQSSRAALFCSLKGVHFVLPIRKIFMQAWDLYESSRTPELAKKMLAELDEMYYNIIV